MTLVITRDREHGCSDTAAAPPVRGSLRGVRFDGMDPLAASTRGLRPVVCLLCFRLLDLGAAAALEYEAAVDSQDGTGDVVGLVGTQESSRFTDVRRSAQSAPR